VHTHINLLLDYDVLRHLSRRHHDFLNRFYVYHAKNQKGMVIIVDVKIGDIVLMKKEHPCGCNRFVILRIGVDFKIRCEKCGHEIMVPRVKIEKSIKSIIPVN